MNQEKDVRWHQRFENFEKSYKTLGKYIDKHIETELERAGIIQLFEIAFELSWKLMKDYLEAQELSVKSPREAIKQAFQIELIDYGHVWSDALADRNLLSTTYDEILILDTVKNIRGKYFDILEKLYNRMSNMIA